MSKFNTLLDTLKINAHNVQVAVYNDCDDSCAATSALYYYNTNNDDCKMIIYKDAIVLTLVHCTSDAQDNDDFTQDVILHASHFTDALCDVHKNVYMLRNDVNQISKVITFSNN